MAKADTGVAGPVVAELAYRNEYVSVRGQARFAEEAWQRNKCHATGRGRLLRAPAARRGQPPRRRQMAGRGRRCRRSRSGSAVY